MSVPTWSRSVFYGRGGRSRTKKRSSSNMAMRERLINAGLVVVSLVAGYLVLDFGVFHRFIDQVPLRLNQHLGRLKVFGQSSKAGPIPRDYVAVFGDSYAAGAGAWLFEVGNDGNPDFQATHVLHRLTGRDVVTFGAVGTGQLQNAVVEPVKAFESINIGSAFHLDAPGKIFAYFYEGNDLSDNRFEIRELLRRTNGSPSEEDIAAYVREVAAEESARIRHGWHPWKNAFLLDFALNLLRYNWRQLLGTNPPVPLFRPPLPGTTTAARIGGRTVALPDGLQGPDLELTPEQTATGVEVFRASLTFFRGYFAGVPITVVYIPAVLSAYDVVSNKVSVAVQPNNSPRYQIVHDAKAVPARSDEICRLIQAEAARLGVGFLDTRSTMRAASAKEPLHGPLDWDHFNRYGYTTLAEALAKALTAGDAAGSCVQLAAQ
ncbi:MAG: hypothetical protein ACHQAY_23125 [Hyphomicrobiales bacterium]